MFSYKIFLLVFFSFTVVSVLGLGYVVFYHNPVDAPIWSWVILYASLSLLVFTGLSLALSLSKRIFTGRRADDRTFTTILREAALVAVIVDIALFFQSLRVLNIFTALLLIASAVILELYFLNR